MKKIISLFLVCAFVFGMIPSSAMAADVIGNISEDSDISTDKIDNVVPCFGDYEFSENAGEYSTMSTGVVDQYEDNNSTSKATRIIPPPTGEPQDAFNIISATLHKETWFFGLVEKSADEDYYYFDLFGEAYVTINLTNIPSGYDYELKLFMHANGIDVSESDINQVAASLKGGNMSESITITLQPGRYYIWVYAYNENCNDSAYHNLSVKVEYTAKDVSINYLRYNKGAKAAVWLSDYDPCGIAPYSTISDIRVGWHTTNTTIGVVTNKFSNPYTNHFMSTSSPIEHAVIYIWDNDLKADLREEILSLIDDLEKELEDAEEYELSISHASEFTNGAFFVVGIVLTFIPFKSACLGATVSIGGSVLGSGVNEVLALLLQEASSVVVSKGELINYLDVIQAAIEPNVSGSDLDTVMIPTHYVLRMEHYPTLAATEYYCDFTPVAGLDHHYFQDIIYSYRANSIVNGTIYAIKDYSNVLDLIEHIESDLPDLDSISYTSLVLSNAVTATIDDGDYQWYEFVAPSSGSYTFRTEGNLDTIGEMYYGVVPDNVTFGLIAENDDEYTDDGNDPDRNFSFARTLEVGERVYIRVSSWEAGEYTMRVVWNGI